MFGTRPSEQQSDFIQVFSIKPGKNAFVWIVSEPLSVPTHYFGRQYICIDSECPLCELQQPRWLDVFFADVKIGASPQKRELVSLDVAAVYKAKGPGAKLTIGEIYEIKRADSPHSPYVLTEKDEKEVTNPVTDLELISAYCRLHRISSPLANEGLLAWKERIQPTLLKIATGVAQEKSLGY